MARQYETKRQCESPHSMKYACAHPNCPAAPRRRAGGTMTEDVVVAFLKNVDFHKEDVRLAVHGCPIDQLRQRLADIAGRSGHSASHSEIVYLAGRLREIVRLP